MIAIFKSMRRGLHAILICLVCLGLYNIILYSTRYIQHPIHYVGRIRQLDYRDNGSGISMDDLELIFDTYFDLGNQYWNIPSYINVFFVFEDKDTYYFAPTGYAVFVCANMKNAIQVSKHTGKVFNRFEKRWVASGYLCESVDMLKQMLKGKTTLFEVIHILGRPFLMHILDGGIISLEYGAKGGVIRIEFKNGFFQEILFYEASRV